MTNGDQKRQKFNDFWDVSIEKRECMGIELTSKCPEIPHIAGQGAADSAALPELAKMIEALTTEQRAALAKMLGPSGG